MTHVLTDNDSFDAAAEVPDDGEPNTAASIEGELQVLQNRSTYNKNRVSDLTAIVASFVGQLTGKLVTVSANRCVTDSAPLYGNQTSVSFVAVGNANKSMTVNAGDIVQLNLGPFLYKTAGSGTTTIRFEITEDNSGTPTTYDFDDPVIATGSTFAPYTFTKQHTVVHAGVLSLVIWLQGDGTHLLEFASRFNDWGYINVLRAIT